MNRSWLGTCVVLAAVSWANSLQAQMPASPVRGVVPPVASVNEGAVARARRAAELRDSLIVLGPTLDQAATSAGITGSVVPFLKQPFDSTNVAPTLNELDDAIARVNVKLRAMRDALDNPVSGVSLSDAANAAGTAAAVATGGTSALLTNLAQGGTAFFVERAKDEAAFGFVLSLKRSIRNDQFIQHALPSSYALMQQIESETFQSFMPRVRTAMAEDLDKFPTRTEEIATGLGLSAEQRTYLQGVAIAYTRGLDIRRGTPPAVALSQLVDLTSTQMENGRLRRALHLVGLLSREYAAAGGQPLIDQLTQKDRGWMRRYFVAYLTRDAIQLDTTIKLPAFLAFMSAREADAILLLNQLHSVRNAVSDLSVGADSTKASSDRVAAAAGAVLGVLRIAPRLAYLPASGPGAATLLGSATPTPSDEITDAVARFERFTADAVMLHQALTRRDYGAIVTWLVQNPNLRLCEAVTTDTASTSKPRRCQTRMKYLSFAASLATANTADEVATAIRTAAAPVGSYRVKRGRSGTVGPRTVSVLGYLGAGYYSTDRTDGEYGRWGVTLPVGAEASLGLPVGAISVFVPIVDLGPVANAQLFDDEDLDNGVDLDGLLAPGAFVVLNATRTFPISFGLGVQSVAQTRQEGDETRQVRVGRTLLFVGIDTTIFNFRF